MKYVIFLAEDEFEKDKKSFYPLFFPEHVTHADVHLYARGRHRWLTGELVSAGFCYIKDKGVVVVDDKISESTGKGPGKHDREILELAMQGAWRGKFFEENFK